MTPDRWRRLEELFEAVRNLPPSERRVYLMNVDPELGSDLEAFLAQEGSMLEHPAWEAHASLLQTQTVVAAGAQFGPYKVQERIGAGGMGEVFRAIDTRLGRAVALKTCREEFSERFQREARTIAALNHPHICSIYDVGPNYLVMELLDGESLAEKLKRGKVSIAQTLLWGQQIADALSIAHSKGIVHRDIKPANLMITASGVVKVLDFGLAKHASSEGSVITEAGTAVGTPAYMSPEQALGKELDSRTDLFSLGVVLYEMATGTRPFAGNTSAALFDAILNKAPLPLSQLSPPIPQRLVEILGKALEKDPVLRYQHAADLATDLKRLVREIESGHIISAAVAPPATRTIRYWLPLVGSALVIVVAAAAYYRLAGGSGDKSPSATMKISRVTVAGDISSSSISPDGKYVAYVVGDPGRSLWVRQVATGSNIQVLPPASVTYDRPTFSRDSNYIYYTRLPDQASRRDVYKVPALGGEPAKIAEEVISLGVGISPDDRRIAYLRSLPGRNGAALVIANADGTGEEVLKTRHSPNALPAPAPAWSPDNSRIATMTSEGLMAIDIVAGKEQPIPSKGLDYVEAINWPQSSSLIIAAQDWSVSPGTQLWQFEFPSGKRKRITNELAYYENLSLTSDLKSLAATRGEIVSNIWLARTGAPRLTQVTSDASCYGLNGLAWTPEKRLVYSNIEGGLSIMDENGEHIRQLTRNQALYPSVCGQQRGVLFLGPDRNLRRIGLNGGSAAQLTSDRSARDLSCSADGKSAVFQSRRNGATRLWKIPIEGGDAMQLTDYPAYFPTVSPDGNWIACLKLPKWQLVILPVSGGPPSKTLNLTSAPLSPDGRDDFPLAWSPDGRMIGYVSSKNGVQNIWAKPVDDGPPKQLTDLKTDTIFGFAWSSDGTLAIARGHQTSDAVIIQNFR